MSSSDAQMRPARRALVRFGLAAGLSLALAGCFRPAYGDLGSPSHGGGGGPVAANLAAVDIKPIEGRVGGKLRNELIFLLRGGGALQGPSYRLDFGVIQRGQSPIVDPYTGQPETRTVSLLVNYELKPYGKLDTILTGQEFATVSYSFTLQRFANIRAQRDAEDRAATQIAEKIRTRLQAHFATGG